MDRNLRIRMLLEAGDRVTRPLRDIAGGSTAAARALKATRDRLKEVDRAQSDIGDFRRLKGGLRESEAAMRAAQARATALGREIASVEKPTRAMARDFAKAKREAAELEGQHRATGAQLGILRGRIEAAGGATTALGRHQHRLRTEAAGLNAELSEQGRRMQQLDDRSRRLARGRANFARGMNASTGLAAGGASAIGTGMAMGAPILGAIQAAQTFESKMTDIGQKAGLTRAHTRALGADLLRASRAANQLPADMQAGVDVLTGLGASVPNAVAMMGPIGRAGTAYKAEIADLSAAAYAATDNLKVPIDQTARLIDIMATSGKLGAFEVKDMAGAFPALTAAYQGLGQSGTGAVADLAAGLQIARKGAGDSASAATNLSNVLQKISSPATNRAFAKMGVDLPAALRRAYAEGKTPLEAIAELTNRTLKGDLSKLGYLFEDAQVQQGLRPLIQNMEEYRSIRAKSLAGGGATERDFAERMKDSAEQAKALRANAQVLAVSLGSALLPAVNAVVGKATAFATWIGDVAQRHPMLTKAVLIGAAGFAALFLVLGGGAILIAGLIAPFAALSFAAGALGIGLLPIIGIAAGVVAGVTALGAAAYLIYANWGAVSDWFSGIWNGIADAVSRNWTTIRNVALGLTVIFFPMVAAAALAAKAIYDRWDDIKAAFGNALAYMNGIVGPLVAPFTRFLGFLASLDQKFKQAGMNIILGIGRGIMNGASWLLKLVVGLAGRIGTRFAAALGIRSPSRVFAGFGGNIIDGLTNGIAAQESEPVRRMDGLSRRLSAAIVTSAAAPALASGATAPLNAVPAAAGGGGMTVVFQIHGAPGQSPQDIAQACRNEWEKMQREQNAARLSSFADRDDF